MTGTELNNVKSLVWSFEALKLKEPYPTLNFGGVEKIGERDAYVFRTTTADRKRCDSILTHRVGCSSAA